MSETEETRPQTEYQPFDGAVDAPNETAVTLINGSTTGLVRDVIP